MATVVGIGTLVATLVGVLISLATFTPSARRMRKLTQEIALLKDLREGEVRTRVEAMAKRSLDTVEQASRSRKGYEHTITAAGYMIAFSIACLIVYVAISLSLSTPANFKQAVSELAVFASRSLIVGVAGSILASAALTVVAGVWAVYEEVLRPHRRGSKPQASDVTTEKD